MISKTIINAGLAGFYPVVVLSDENNEVYLYGSDYASFRHNEGMTDHEIMNFAGVV